MIPQTKGIRDYYDSLVQKPLSDFQRVGWKSLVTQSVRFSVFYSMAPLEGCQILDAGCGTGAFYQFLSEQAIEVEYTGIDISPKMIAEAKRLNPAITACERDMFDPEFSTKYDYVFASGVFSLRQDDTEELAQSGLIKLFQLSHLGCGVNFLSDLAPEEEKDEKRFYYFNPTKILDFCFTLTPYVELRHNYLANDFTVFLWR